MALSGAVAMYSGNPRMGGSSRKPYTAVTVQIDNLTSESYEVDDSTGIIDLIEVIRIQSTGPTEAARALRKKLKYGDIHRQLRALTILDLLIQNAGSHFTSRFADEPLLERLRIAGTDITSDPQVKQKCKVLFAQWSTLRDVPGMARVAALYAQLPRKPRATHDHDRKQNSRVLRETEYSPAHAGGAPEFGHSVSVAGGHGPSTVVGSRTYTTPGGDAGSKPKKEKKHRHTFSGSGSATHTHSHSHSHSHARHDSLDAPSVTRVRETLANARIAADGLMNALRLVNRERESVSENPDVVRRFQECKTYRRQILKYIHGINDEDYLGSLLTANEELVNALMSFEVLDKALDDDDSDSEVEEGSRSGGNGSGSGNGGSPANAPAYDENRIDTGMAALALQSKARPPPPPVPAERSAAGRLGKQAAAAAAAAAKRGGASEEEDENDPFGDKNAI